MVAPGVVSGAGVDVVEPLGVVPASGGIGDELRVREHGHEGREPETRLGDGEFAGTKLDRAIAALGTGVGGDRVLDVAIALAIGHVEGDPSGLRGGNPAHVVLVGSDTDQQARRTFSSHVFGGLAEGVEDRGFVDEVGGAKHRGAVPVRVGGVGEEVVGLLDDLPILRHGGVMINNRHIVTDHLRHHEGAAFFNARREKLGEIQAGFEEVAIRGLGGLVDNAIEGVGVVLRTLVPLRVARGIPRARAFDFHPFGLGAIEGEDELEVIHLVVVGRGPDEGWTVAVVPIEVNLNHIRLVGAVAHVVVFDRDGHMERGALPEEVGGGAVVGLAGSRNVLAAVREEAVNLSSLGRLPDRFEGAINSHRLAGGELVGEHRDHRIHGRAGQNLRQVITHADGAEHGVGTELGEDHAIEGGAGTGLAELDGLDEVRSGRRGEGVARAKDVVGDVLGGVVDGHDDDVGVVVHGTSDRHVGFRGGFGGGLDVDELDRLAPILTDTGDEADIGVIDGAVGVGILGLGQPELEGTRAGFDREAKVADAAVDLGGKLAADAHARAVLAEGIRATSKSPGYMKPLTRLNGALPPVQSQGACQMSCQGEPQPAPPSSPTTPVAE